MKFIRQLLKFITKWFWTEPVSKDKPIKATEVLHNYTCIKYRDQWLTLRLHEVAAFEAMARKDKRGMARKFEVMEKKGKIKFVEIEGKMVCILNKNYESKQGSSK